MTKYKLVLSGSGLKYPVFVGAIKRLKKVLGIDRFEAILGISGGSVVGAGEATGMSIKELEALVKRVNPAALMDLNWTPFGATQGIMAGKKFLRQLRIELPETFAEFQVPLYVGTFNLTRGAHQIWSSKTTPKADAPLCVRGSISLPGIMDAVEIPYEMSRPDFAPKWNFTSTNKEFHVDGGVGANFPLDFFGDGKDVIGLRFQPAAGAKKIESKLDFFSACLDGMMESSTREHVEDATHARQIYLNTSGGGLDFNLTPEKIDALIQDGVNSVDAALRAGLTL